MTAQPVVVYAENSRASDCPISKHRFAEGVVNKIIEAVPGYRWGTLNVTGYTPPYEGTDFPGGFLEINLLLRHDSDASEASLGVIFGEEDDRGHLVRHDFEATRWLRDRHNPLASGIIAANFDEAWRIVCLLGKRLNVVQVTIGYGS